MNVLSSSDESSDEEEILRNFEVEACLIVRTDTLPKKSADKYILNYEAYKKWQKEHENSLSNSGESNLIVYFKELSKTLRPSTIWSTWSMLKKTLNSIEKIDIGKFQNLKSLIKNNSKGYRPEKSLVLKWSDVSKFLDSAPDTTHLDQKVILIFGICGALRCQEIYKLKRKDVEDLGDRYLISINDTKNDVPRQFIIGQLYYKKVKKYVSLRPEGSFSENFFIQYRNGKCIQQNIGRNMIGTAPYRIAVYLELPDPKCYTGHCFRRTAATLLSNSGANTTMLKQLGGWKSTAIAQGYVENSLRNREKIFHKITGSISRPVPEVDNNNNSKQSTSETYSNITEDNTNFQNTDYDFDEDLTLNSEDLAAIDNINEPEKTVSPPSSTTTNPTATTKFTTNSQRPALAQHTHFTAKVPINVFNKEPANEPPQKRSKLSLKTVTKENESYSSSNADPCNTYNNCTFNGNIINNFYCSCIGNDCDKKENVQ